jgi:hypothetical protein
LGLSPNDVGVDQDKWDSNFEALEKAKHLFRSSCLMQKIRGSNEEVRRSLLVPPPRRTPMFFDLLLVER